ncbi:MAG: TVP38/TMEM64 family protein [Oscillospiraceae bacterium]|nr:TVP38/TMEM64 family protein [Oscillospiraceae bacterium]
MTLRKENLIKNLVTWMLVLLLALSAVFVGKAWAGGHFKSMDTLRAYLESYGGWGPVVLTLIQALQVVLPVLPGFLGCIVGAALFGAAGGFWVNYIGISAGSLIAYWLARRFGIGLVQKMVPMEKYERCVRWVNQKKSYSLVLFLAILLPLAPDDFLCYFSGLTAMSSRKFTWIILLGKPWCILFYSIFFAHLI